MTISQSYHIGAQQPGDVVVPVRVVVDAEARVVIRCVGLREGGYGCTTEWRSERDIYQPWMFDFTHVLTHMEACHTERTTADGDQALRQ